MSHNEEHHHESPKRVYFGIPFGFALAFWLIIFFSLKACDGNKNGCCKEGKECSKECMEKCKAEGKEGCLEKEGAAEEKKDAVSEEKKETEEKKDAATEEKAEKPSEEKPAAEEKH
jgi:hypothetical protein